MIAAARTARIALCTVAAMALVLPAASAQAEDAACADVPGAAPGRTVAWRAQISARVAVFDRLPEKTRRPSRRLSPNDAPWLLIVGRPRAADGRCWLRVRLPRRPNHASGWIDAAEAGIQRTPWRIDVDRRRRTLVVYRAGVRVRSMPVVVGKPGTPTPVGLFAVTWAIRWRPHAFLGSWVLELTAHSNVLQRYDGGDGTVAIHGRGGASLRDPLGTARSHGCVRLANAAIEWLVRRIGANRLPGTPVNVR
jgi:lipoprotein-anchoring transpeptidase ErfK/SrfK